MKGILNSDFDWKSPELATEEEYTGVGEVGYEPVSLDDPQPSEYAALDEEVLGEVEGEEEIGEDYWERFRTAKVKTWNPETKVIDEVEVPTWQRAARGVANGLKSYGLTLLKTGGDESAAWGAGLETAFGDLDSEVLAEKKDAEHRAQVMKFAEGGKYTPKSLKAFAESGNVEDLEAYSKDGDGYHYGTTSMGDIYDKRTGSVVKEGRGGKGSKGSSSTKEAKPAPGTQLATIDGQQYGMGYHKVGNKYYKVSGKGEPTPVSKTEFDEFNYQGYEDGQTLNEFRPTKAPTESAGKNIDFLRTGMRAYEDMEEASFGSDPSLWSGYVNTGIVPKFRNDEDRQLHENASKRLAMVILRKESGAAITADEMKMMNENYVIGPGDTKKVVERKRAALRERLNGMADGSGEAFQFSHGSLKAMDERLAKFKESKAVKGEEATVQKDTAKRAALLETANRGLDPDLVAYAATMKEGQTVRDNETNITYKLVGNKLVKQ